MKRKDRSGNTELLPDISPATGLIWNFYIYGKWDKQMTTEEAYKMVCDKR